MNNNNRKHEIVEPLTLLDLYGSLSSAVETGKEKSIEVRILVPNFTGDHNHLTGYKIGKPILNASGCEVGFDVGDKLLKVSINSVRKYGKDLFFEGMSDDNYKVRIYISRVNNRILKFLKFI
ncbi:MAG: hypothetical protein U9N04_02035 [Patescibacteria group bacterium]|nr:hypothetical protein [Patescibacteria group bacterium]